MGIYRGTIDEDLITQIDVFDERMSVDQEEALEEININNHKDIFRAVYIKVRSLLYLNVDGCDGYGIPPTGCWYS